MAAGNLAVQRQLSSLSGGPGSITPIPSPPEPANVSYRLNIRFLPTATICAGERSDVTGGSGFCLPNQFGLSNNPHTLQRSQSASEVPQCVRPRRMFSLPVSSRRRQPQPTSLSIARKHSLADAVADAAGKAAVITFTGVCAGPVVIQADGLTLQGIGEAIIDGGGQDAVSIAGAGRVSLAGIEIRNGRHGIVAVNGAHVSLTALNVHDNVVSGISLQTGSSAVFMDVTTAQNGVHGLDVQGWIRGDGERHAERDWESRVRHQRQWQLDHVVAGSHRGGRECARDSNRHERQRVHFRLGQRDQRKRQSRHGPDHRVRFPPGLVRGHHTRVGQCRGSACQ